MGILREVTLHFIRQSFPRLFNTLRVSLGRGHVDSTDIVLSKSDPISVSGIPWQIADGNFSGLSLQLPWMNRLGAKFSVKVKSAYIHLTEVPFPTMQQLVFNALTDELRRKKFRIVAEAERHEAPFGSSVHQIMSQVLERIELQVENFTAVLEFADGFVGTFSVAKLLAHRPEASSKEQSCALVISIENISATIKSPSNDVPVPLNIPDFSISAGIELDGDTLKLQLDIIRTIEVSVHSCLREVVHSLKLRRAQWWLAYKWSRPINFTRTDAVSWMRYAYRRVSASHGLQSVSLDVQRVRQSLRRFIEYKNLHVKRLHKSRLKTEEVSKIAELEESFDADLILLLRHAAKRHVAADEACQFGTSEWLRWILFGHQMSSERDRLTADVKRSLEQSTGAGTIINVPRSQCEHKRIERYAFQCSLNGLSGLVSAGIHELRISLAQVGFNVGLESATGHYSVGLDLEHLIISVDGDIVARKQSLSEDGADRDHGTPQLSAGLSCSSDRTSSSVNLNSMFLMLHPKIFESFSFILQRWTSPLVPTVFNRRQHDTQSFVQDGQSESFSISYAGIIWTIGNIHALLLDDRIIYRGRSPALSMTLNQATIRTPPSRTSFIPELDGSLSLEASEVDVTSTPISFALPEARDTSLQRQRFVSFSADLHLSWKSTLTVNFSNSGGFIRVPTLVRVLSRLLRTARSSQFLEPCTSESGRIALHSTPEPAYDISNIQERFAQSGFLFVFSTLAIDVLWASRSLSHAFLLEIKQWETELTSRTFSLDSMRIGNIRISSPDTTPFMTLIEATSNLEPALRLKRGSHPQIGDHLFEVLIGDVSVQLCADAILAVSGLISETLRAPSRSSRTVQDMSSSEADGRHVTTLLSLLAASLNVRWSDGHFQAEINCSDIQVTSKRNEFSGSAETVTLTRVNAKHDGSPSASEVILHVTDPLMTNSSVLRFLCEPAGFHIDLNNLTACAKRSFWDPLVLSITNVLERINEQHDHEKVSKVEALQDDDKGLPIRINSSGLLVVLPVPKLGSPQIQGDVSHVSVLLQSGQQRLSFRRTAILINHVHSKSRILQTAGFEVQHKSVASLQDALLHYSDTWDLTVSNEIAVILSPNSLSTVRIGIADLLFPFQSTGRASDAQSRTGTCADTSRSVSGRTRALFHGSIKSIRLTVGIDRGVNDVDPLAAIEAQDISLSSAEVYDSLDTGNCEVTVLSWLASCRVLRLLKYQPSSPEPWRVIIGRDIRRFAQNCSAPNLQGLSVRRISRQDHGRDITTFNVHMSDVSVIFDPDMFAKLSKFITDCSNTADQDALKKTRESQGEKDNDYHGREISAKCDSSRTTEPSSCPSTSQDRRIACSYGSRTKIDIHLANFTILCSLDEECDSVYFLRLHVRKTGVTFVVSSFTQPVNGSSVLFDGISLRVNSNPEGTERVLDPITEEQRPGGRIYTSEGPSNEARYQTRWFGSMPPAASFPQTDAATDMLVATVGHLRATLKRSHEDELMLSIGNVWLDTSIHTLLRLVEVGSSYGVRSSNAAQTFSYSSFAAPSKLRLDVQSITLRLTVNRSLVIHWNKTAPCRRSLTVVLSVSVRCLADVRFQTLQGTLKVALDLSDNSSGHSDPLVSPCVLRYRIAKRREWATEVEMGQLLRVSFSPVTVRMVCALSAVLKKMSLGTSATNSQSVVADTDSRLIVHIHGVAVRCLSDAPRIQVLRLLLGELRFEAAFDVTSGRRLMDCSVREFLLEDTLSWRLFRSGPTESSSRRWERIVASVRRPDDTSATQVSGPLQSLQTKNMRLHTAGARDHERELSIRPAVQCHITWDDFFENLKARICSSGIEINLDLVAIPVVQEWYKSLVQELHIEEDSSSSRLRDQQGLFESEGSPQIMRRAPWISAIYIAPLSITGGIRASPRRLQESLYERMLTRLLNVDSVTGLSLHLPAVRILGRHESLPHVLHQVLLRYSLSTVSREFVWQILTHTGRLFRLARLFTLSLFRQRPYNPLRMPAEKTVAVSADRRSDGLLVVLDSDDISIRSSVDSARTSLPLVVERVGWLRGVGSKRADLGPSSVHVVDLT